jgi:NDP-sugar pyrophosphorylase family protein
MSRSKFTSSVVPTRPTTQQSSAGMSIIITGAMKPHRMSSFGAKPLLAINNMCLIDHVLPVITSTFPNSEIILTIGYEADKLIKKMSTKIKLVENQLFETTNIVEEIRLGLNAVTNKRVLIVDGDILFDKAIFNKLKFDHSFILLDDQLSDDEVGVIVSEGLVENFSFGLPTKWANIAYLVDTELELLRSISADRNNSNLYLFEALNMIINRNGKIYPAPIQNTKIKKINSTKELRNENSNNT